MFGIYLEFFIKYDCFPGRDIFSAIKVLQNSKAPLPKKRQTMRASCGDYRAKMEAEEKKFRLGAVIKRKYQVSFRTALVSLYRCQSDEEIAIVQVSLCPPLGRSGEAGGGIHRRRGLPLLRGGGGQQ